MASGCGKKTAQLNVVTKMCGDKPTSTFSHSKKSGFIVIIEDLLPAHRSASVLIY